MNVFSITTHHRGSFSKILDLATFSKMSIPESEFPFFVEVMEIFENDSIDILNLKQPDLTTENVLDLLLQHEKTSFFYSQEISKEIDFISSHFFEICEKNEQKLKRLSFDCLSKILSHKNLRLKNEDQLLKFIISICIEFSNDSSQYSELYSNVLFANVEESTIGEFASSFDFNDLNSDTWMSLLQRLKLPVLVDIKPKERYSSTNLKVNNQEKTFPAQGDETFNGIIKYLNDKTNGNIINEIDITSSSISLGNEPIKATLFDDLKSYFHTNGEENSYICFDFKDKRIVPTHYQLRSGPWYKNAHNPKNWVIEVSNDNQNWEIIDEQKECEIINGKSIAHLFQISNSNSNEFRYIKMRQNGKNCAEGFYFNISSFELYGKLKY